MGDRSVAGGADSSTRLPYQPYASQPNHPHAPYGFTPSPYNNPPSQSYNAPSSQNHVRDMAGQHSGFDATSSASYNPLFGQSFRGHLQFPRLSGSPPLATHTEQMRPARLNSYLLGNTQQAMDNALQSPQHATVVHLAAPAMRSFEAPDVYGGGLVPTTDAQTPTMNALPVIANANSHGLQYSSYDEAHAAFESTFRRALKVRSDDVDEVERNQYYYVRMIVDALKHIGYDDAPETWKSKNVQTKKHEDVPVSDAKKAEFNRWQDMAAQGVEQIRSHPRFDEEAEQHAWNIFNEMLKCHRLGHRLTNQPKALTLTCSERIEAGVSMMKSYAIVRKKLLENDKVHDFCISPEAYANTTIKHFRNNSSRGNDGTKTGNAVKAIPGRAGASKGGAASKRRKTEGGNTKKRAGKAGQEASESPAQESNDEEQQDYDALLFGNDMTEDLSLTPAETVMQQPIMAPDAPNSLPYLPPASDLTFSNEIMDQPYQYAPYQADYRNPDIDPTLYLTPQMPATREGKRKASEPDETATHKRRRP